MPRLRSRTPRAALLGTAFLLAGGLVAVPPGPAAPAPDEPASTPPPSEDAAPPVLARMLRLNPTLAPRPGGGHALTLDPQEVAALFPEAVAHGADGSVAVDSAQLAVLAVQAIRELAAQGPASPGGSDRLALRLEVLERQNTELRRGLDELRRQAPGTAAARLDAVERENADLRRELERVSAALGNPSATDRALGFDRRMDDLERENRGLRSALDRLERQLINLERRIRG